jgi:hypothetical protein
MTLILPFTFAAMLAMPSLATLAADAGSIAFSSLHRESCHGAINMKHTLGGEIGSPHVYLDAAARSGCVPILLPMLPSS